MSVEPGPRGEAGEETTTEKILPLGNDQQDFPSRFQRPRSLRATRLVRVNARFWTMANRGRIDLQNHRPRLVEGRRQTAQPAHESPDQGVGDDRLVGRRTLVRRRFSSHRWITNQGPTVTHALAIGGLRFLEILSGARQQTGSGESLIRQDESPGGR
jgi:hypothetical protein